MKVVMAGASGLLGSALRDRLAASGHQVTSLVRRAPSGPGEVRWNPDSGHLDPAVLAGSDAVISLSGAGIGDRRWTAEYKRTLINSRIKPTSAIAEALAQLADDRPGTWLSASAIGFYGERGDEQLDENSAAGTGFLADLVVDWEQSTAPAERAGVRVAHLRTGLVLSADGGLLGRLVPIFKLGAGGKLGSGRQWQSWITVDDWVRAAEFVLTTDAVSGAVDLTAPEPQRNSDLAAALGAALHRPALFPTPALAIRVAIGEFADEGVLVSQRVLPKVLTEAGFVFDHEDLAAGLAHVLA